MPARRELVIVGVTRNCGSTIERDVGTLRSAFASFRQIRWFVVESDSEDDTVDCLRRLATDVPGFSYVSLGRLRDRYPRRTERIAVCRNVYLDALEGEPFARADYIAVADLDGINGQLTREAVDSCWTAGIAWDGCFANQHDLYYDVWALRHPDWNPGDCWRQQRFLMRFARSPAQAEYTSTFGKMIAIPPRSPWLEVDSAFGGLGIYRREALIGVRYSGLADGQEVCEHIEPHRMMRDGGARLFINPRLVNGGANEHSRPALRYEIQTGEPMARRLVARGKWLGRRFLSAHAYEALKSGLQRVSLR